MQRLEDISPHAIQHAAIPNDTVDHLISTNPLALAVLTSFVRHSDSYGWTLTKLVKSAKVHGEKALSAAYNVCIEGGYLGRVEYTYERPAGDTGRNNRRATYAYMSRVPISQARFDKVVHDYTPGRYVMTPIATGAVDEHGHEVYELRRTKVVAAEIYCHLGAMRIDRDGMLTEHTNRRGGKSKAALARAAKNTASPEPALAGSGATSENDAKPQVPPEPALPESGGAGSIKKKNQKTKEDQGAPASLRSLGTGQTPPQAPGFTPYVADGALEQWERSNTGSAGDPLAAREAELEADQAQPAATNDHAPSDSRTINDAQTPQNRATAARTPSHASIEGDSPEIGASSAHGATGRLPERILQ